MKELKDTLKYNNKGITLISLVVTIIMLLILAGVTIATLIGNNGILNKAKKAKEETLLASEEELRRLTILEAETNLENQTYTDKNGDVATIPAGFAVSQVEGENIIKDGLVIIDTNENEFVWIPVENPNEMYGVDINGKLWGKLYSFENNIFNPLNWEEKEGMITIIETEGANSKREPDYMKKSQYGDSSLEGINLLKSVVNIPGENDNEVLTNWAKQLESEFNTMINSIKKYNGFYIGRYETSLNDVNVAQSTKDSLPATASNLTTNTWYGLYEKQKSYYSNSIRGEYDLGMSVRCNVKMGS